MLAPHHYKRTTTDDAGRWAEKYRGGCSVLKIAEDEHVNPGTVSAWLHKTGVRLGQGQHRVKQPELRVAQRVLQLVARGPEAIRGLVEDQTFGVGITAVGVKQLERYCRFFQLYREKKGVKEIANVLEVHRSTISEWRAGTNLPYLMKVASSIADSRIIGWKWLPLTISAGGNSLGDFVQVPTRIEAYRQILHVIGQLHPLEVMYARGATFGIGRARLHSMLPELFAYLLGFMLGDASKLGGQGKRFASLNLDLQLSLKHDTNHRLGEFVCMCANSLGIRMDRIADKQPTGDSKYGQQPTGAYRWSSERSPLLAWAFTVGLGLGFDENTSHDQVKMRWVLYAAREFRVRFIQGLADSDATVKPYEVILTSVPNAEFATKMLQSVGMTSAHTIREYGEPLRTMVNRREAISLPMFNEFARSYRYDQLNRPFLRRAV